MPKSTLAKNDSIVAMNHSGLQMGMGRAIPQEISTERPPPSIDIPLRVRSTAISVISTLSKDGLDEVLDELGLGKEDAPVIPSAPRIDDANSNLDPEDIEALFEE